MTSYTAPLVGAFYRPPAQTILKFLPAACPLRAQPEPENPHDPNAVAIYVASSSIPESAHPSLEEACAGSGVTLDQILSQPEWHLGYLAKDYAAAMVALICKHTEAGTINCVLSFMASGKPQVFLTLDGEE